MFPSMLSGTFNHFSLLLLNLWLWTGPARALRLGSGILIHSNLTHPHIQPLAYIFSVKLRSLSLSLYLTPSSFSLLNDYWTPPVIQALLGSLRRMRQGFLKHRSSFRKNIFGKAIRDSRTFFPPSSSFFLFPFFSSLQTLHRPRGFKREEKTEAD